MRGQVVTTAVIAGVLLSGCQPFGRSPALPKEEPPHQVEYSVGAVGSANDDVQITYTDGSGGNATATAPGVAPFWSGSVTTEAGLSELSLQAGGSSSDLAFKLSCVITVDKIEVARNSGPYSCSATFDLRDFAVRKAAEAAKSPSPSPASSPSPAVPSSAAAPVARPKGCRFVEDGEIVGIITSQTGTVKPVQYTSGDDNTCTYGIDYEDTRVTVKWKPGGKVQPIYGTGKEPGLGVTAYWSDLGTFGILDVQRKTGALSITVTVSILLNLDRKKFAVEVLKAAKPRLPR
jgi:hypothetical protein